MNINKKLIYNICRYLLLLLLLISIAQAFYQSSLSPAKSTAQSDKVGEIIEEIIPPETPQGQFVQTNIRKLAHFTEFLFIGLFASLYAVFYMKKSLSLPILLPFGIFIGLLDETVQIFSDRGPSIKDVWIDALGYATAAVTVVIVYYAVTLIVGYIKKQREGVE